MTSPIVTRAPTRIDFGGGWTDVPPYSEEAGGFVCNVAITRYATATIFPRETAASASSAAGRASDRALADAAARRLGVRDVGVRLHSDFPIGAGLGGSSAAGVAVVAALDAHLGVAREQSEIAELSRDVEIEDLGIAGGRQDHYAAVYGGALALRFSEGPVDVRRVPMSEAVRSELERRCLIIYTGQSRISGDTIKAVMQAYKAKDQRVLFALRRSSELAEQMADALGGGDVGALAGLVGEQWAHQRALHPAIPTPLIDEIVSRAHDAGAAGAKALGASGGGCVLVIARDDRVDDVRAAVTPLGEPLSFAIDLNGVTRCE